MNTRWHVVSIGAAALLLSGCYTTGLSVRESARVNYSSYLYALYGAGDPKSVAGDRPTLWVPAKLAVAQVGEVSPPQAMLTQLAEARDLFSAVQGIPAAPGPAPQDTSTTEDQDAVREHVRQMRRFAADLGMEYLFLFGGTIDVGESATGAEILDWTVVGMYIPTHKVHGLGRASGALVDVASGQVLFIVTAEEELKTYDSTMARSYGNNDAHVIKIRQRLIPKLTAAFIERAQQQT